MDFTAHFPPLWQHQHQANNFLILLFSVLFRFLSNTHLHVHTHTMVTLIFVRGTFRDTFQHACNGQSLCSLNPKPILGWSRGGSLLTRRLTPWKLLVTLVNSIVSACEKNRKILPAKTYTARCSSKKKPNKFALFVTDMLKLVKKNIQSLINHQW